MGARGLDLGDSMMRGMLGRGSRGFGGLRSH